MPDEARQLHVYALFAKRLSVLALGLTSLL